MAEEFFCKLF